MIKITKEFTAEIAHRLHNHPGKCQNIHGHSYRFQVTVCGFEGRVNSVTGMVMDFSKLKSIMEFHIGKWDHSLLLYELDPLVPILQNVPGINLQLFPEIPTAENMAKYIGESLECESVKVWETDTSYAEWECK